MYFPCCVPSMGPIWHCFNLTDTGVCPLSSGPSPASRRVRCRLVVTFSTACLPPPVASWPKSTKVLPAHRPNLTTRGLGIGFPGRLQNDAQGNWERESGSAVAHANLGLILSTRLGWGCLRELTGHAGTATIRLVDATTRLDQKHVNRVQARNAVGKDRSFPAHMPCHTRRKKLRRQVGKQANSEVGP